MKAIITALNLFALLPLATGAAMSTTNETKPAIVVLNPPELGFFSKQLSFGGIPIKAHQVVADEALYAAYDRLALMLQHQPLIASNLGAAQVALHIIGKQQVTTDLPEWRHDKGVPLAEYNGLTRDQRTRGMGGQLVSCGEENLLKLEPDKYRGRDICVHEFAHAIRNLGMSAELVKRFDQQYRRSLAKGLWVGAYSASNAGEFFSELSMWYFGTHGDLNMTGPKPEHGVAGFKKYDPEAYALFDDFYQGRLRTGKVASANRRAMEEPNATNPAVPAPTSKP